VSILVGVDIPIFEPHTHYIAANFILTAAFTPPLGTAFDIFVLIFGRGSISLSCCSVCCFGYFKDGDCPWSLVLVCQVL